MTSEKIKYMLQKVGITEPFDRWMKLPQIPIIYLDEDSNYFISDCDLVYFDSKNNILRVYRDASVRNIEIIQNVNSINAYPANLFYDFKNIAGIIRSVYPGAYGTYYTRPF